MATTPLDPNSAEATIERWRIAMWTSQRMVGLARSPEPITLEWQEAMRAAAEAAWAAFHRSLENHQRAKK